MIKKLIFTSLLLIASCLQTSCAITVRKIKPPQKAFALVKSAVELLVYECKEDKKTKEKKCDYSSAGKRVALGSGTFFSYKGYTSFMTAGHVCLGPAFEIWNNIPNKSKVLTSITLKSYTGHEIKGKIKYVNLKYDMCIIDAVHPVIKNLPKIALSKPVLHDNYYSISAPASIFHVGMVPVLTGLYTGDYKKFSFYTIPTAPGGSGAPIYNKDNKVVGIIQRTHSIFPHVALSIKYKDLKDVMERYVEIKAQDLNAIIE